ncbi:MAG: shikimate dehydrogenase [Chlamydiia bacterium]|nr:shikimate dehydrogenase [Chlamydiia bacterium]
MLFLSITKPQLLQRIPDQVGGVELRLDLFPTWNLESVRTMMSRIACPVIVTLRRASHGGKFTGSEAEREEQIVQLLSLQPDFIDLEYDMRKGFLAGVLKKYSETRVILSYHNFQNTPEDLEGIYHAMTHYPAYQYKIAVTALSTNDALRTLLFARQHPRASLISMGEKGAFARVLGPVVGNQLNYASIGTDEQSAPGQLTLEELVTIYRFPLLNTQTVLYGLIGDPVTKSQGHLYHNAVFSKQGLNAVYVKMSVRPEELSAFFLLANEMGFRGLSVTMPLKEAVLPFVDEIEERAKPIGAVNTLLFHKGKIVGTNTDGTGALDAVEKRGAVRNKSVVLIGAGGAARAIAFEAKARGAHVWIINRTAQKAQALGALVGCRAGGFLDMPSLYDVLIHCAPDASGMDHLQILPSALVMDIVYAPRETAFLREASRRGCQVIYGEEMFWNQAAAQTNFWLEKR